jgi:hypothetical protein
MIRVLAEKEELKNVKSKTEKELRSTPPLPEILRRDLTASARKNARTTIPTGGICVTAGIGHAPAQRMRSMVPPSWEIKLPR